MIMIMGGIVMFDNDHGWYCHVIMIWMDCVYNVMVGLSCDNDHGCGIVMCDNDHGWYCHV